MAVLRESQPLTLGQGGSTAIQQSGAGAAKVDVNAHRGSSGGLPPRLGGITVTAPNTANLELIKGVFGEAKKLGDNIQSYAAQEAYLRGQAAATSGEVESALQENILTRDWATAGFRDTTANLAFAQSEAMLAQDMKTLREKSPQEFSEALADRRKMLLQGMRGMSRSQEAALMAQLASSDQAAILRHAEEHTKFVIDQKAKAVQVNMSTKSELLAASKGTAAYAAETTSYLATAFGQTFGDTSVPQDIQQSLFGEAMALAIGTGNLGVYEQALKAPMTFQDGSEGTAISRLPIRTQLALGDSYRTAVKAQKGQMGLEASKQLAMYQIQFDDPTAPPPPLEEALGFYDQMLTQGYISADKHQSLYKDAAESVWKKNKSVVQRTAWAGGNDPALLAAGATHEEGARAWRDYEIASGKSPEHVVRGLVDFGISGKKGAFRVVGDTLDAAFKSMSSGSTPSEADRNTVEYVMQTMDALTASGKEVARHELLSGLSDESRVVAMLVEEGLRTNPNTAEVWGRARDAYLDRVRLSPQQRAASSASKATDITKWAEGYTAQGVFGKLWEATNSMFGGTQDSRLRPNNDWSLNPFASNSPAVGTQVSDMRAAMTEEMEYLSAWAPHRSVEELADDAISGVLSRTVPTEYGNMYLPRGVQLGSLFGLDPSDNTPERAGIALSNVVKQWTAGTNAESVTLRLSNGSVQAVAWDEDGNETASTTLNPRVVGQELGRIREQEVARTRVQNFGRRQGSITVDGRNPAGIDTDVAYQFRQNLIQNEGFLDTVKVDTNSPSRPLTMGYGLASTNTHWPKDLKAGDKVPPEVIDSTFRAASDDALTNSWRFQSESGLTAPAWTLLFAEMAYQSGNLTAQPQARALARAAVAGDKGAALKALQSSNAFKWSGRHRKEHYAALLYNAMKE